jgi:hypothetical protein
MRAFRFCALSAAVCSAVGCGSRTGLLVPYEVELDASTLPDVTVVPDAPDDVVPPLDVSSPRPVPCGDAGSTFIYLITEQSDLWSFYPPDVLFQRIGSINCPVTIGDSGVPTPFSMAVDQSGTAYVVYNDGNLFRVSLADASCTATSFVPDQQGFHTFGMGFAQNASGMGETLYVASDEDPTSGSPSRLGTIDTNRFVLTPVGPLDSRVNDPELTGTGAGDLFGFYSLIPAAPGVCAPPPSAIGEIDETTGNLVGQKTLPTVAQGCGWAFAFWGGDFYMFTAPGSMATVGPSVVTRYRPSDGSVTQAAPPFRGLIVGAGVSTCAPQQ